MSRNLFSSWGRFAKTVPTAGKEFIVIPSGTATYADVGEMFPTDEDGDPRVFTTIADAITECVSGRGDVIWVYPGTYTISTALAMSKNDVRLLAVSTPGTVILTGSSADIIDLTADGCEIAGFRFNLASAKICIDMAGAAGNHIHDNVFISSVGGAASHFIRMATTACNYNKIYDNRFLSNFDVSGGAITQTSQITGMGSGNIIEHNAFVSGRQTTGAAGAVTDGILFNTAADAGNLVRFNSFTEFNGATFTNGIDYGTTAVGGSVMCYDNNFMLATAGNAVVNGSNAADFANNVASGTV